MGLYILYGQIIEMDTFRLGFLLIVEEGGGVETFEEQFHVVVMDFTV